MKWKLLLRPEAVEHFTSKHPVTKDEPEGILDKPNYIKRISKNRYKFLGRGKSGRYLTIISRIQVYFTMLLPSDQVRRMKRLYRKKSK